MDGYRECMDRVAEAYRGLLARRIIMKLDQSASTRLRGCIISVALLLLPAVAFEGKKPRGLDGHIHCPTYKVLFIFQQRMLSVSCSSRFIAESSVEEENIQFRRYW
jgi:hypothetical protein